MKVTRVKMEGITTSFRYPHFMWGRHPTYEMPPPATIYGHICSAVGEWVEPEEIRFGYWFTYAGKGEDLEHIHAISRREDFRREDGFGKILAWEKETGQLASVGGVVNLLIREFLFLPKMLLYIYPADFTACFRQPCYSTILGRSQDLITYLEVEEVELLEARQAYYEHTLLPWEIRTRIGRGITVTMPRFIDYRKGRRPYFSRYLILHERVVDRPLTNAEDEEFAREMLHYEGKELIHLVDPDSPEITGCHRGVWLHSFVDEGDNIAF